MFDRSCGRVTEGNSETMTLNGVAGLHGSSDGLGDVAATTPFTFKLVVV